MEFKWQVQANNAKGDFVIEVFVDAREADIRHKQLYNEVDDRGLWKWGEIRTINLETDRADLITGILGQPREGKVPNYIADVPMTEDELYDMMYQQDSDGMALLGTQVAA